MKKLVVSLLVLGAMATVACSSKSSGSAGGAVKENTVDKDGNCTDQFLKDFSALDAQNTKAIKTQDMGEVKKLDGQCDGFFKVHQSGVVCRLTLNGQLSEVNTADIKTKCDDVKKIAGGAAGGAPAPARNNGGFP